MTILSQELLFSDNQVITTTAVSTNTIDLGPAGTSVGHAKAIDQDIGKGNPIDLMVNVATAFTGLTSLAVQVQVSADSAFSSPVVVSTTPAILLADLGTPRLLNVPSFIPEGTNQRYVRLNYVVVGTATAGAIMAGISLGRQTSV